jgi:ketosteroid isomerase-like protein
MPPAEAGRGATPSLGTARGNPMPMNARAVLAASVLIAAAACAPKPAAPDTAADEAKLRNESLVWFDHFARADGPAMGNLYAEDALLMPPGTGAVTGRAAIAKFLGDEAAGAKAAGMSLKNREVTGSGIAGDLGWISGTYDVVDASGAAVDSGNYLSVHHRVNGAWLYIRDTWNSDRPPVPVVATPPATDAPAQP